MLHSHETAAGIHGRPVTVGCKQPDHNVGLDQVKGWQLGVELVTDGDLQVRA